MSGNERMLFLIFTTSAFSQKQLKLNTNQHQSVTHTHLPFCLSQTLPNKVCPKKKFSFLIGWIRKRKQSLITSTDRVKVLIGEAEFRRLPWLLDLAVIKPAQSLCCKHRGVAPLCLQ